MVSAALTGTTWDPLPGTSPRDSLHSIGNSAIRPTLETLAMSSASNANPSVLMSGTTERATLPSMTLSPAWWSLTPVLSSRRAAALYAAERAALVAPWGLEILLATAMAARPAAT